MTNVTNAREVVRSKEFIRLAVRRWTVSLSLTVLLMGAYGGYLVLIGFYRSFVTENAVGGIALCVAVGISVIVFAWLLVLVYVILANRFFDPRIKRLRSRLT